MQHKIQEFICEKCSKVIGRYSEDQDINWNAATICQECYSLYKKEVEILIQQMLGKSNIYQDDFRKKMDIYKE